MYAQPGGSLWYVNSCFEVLLVCYRIPGAGYRDDDLS
jgi:hypothetical protein